MKKRIGGTEGKSILAWKILITTNIWKFETVWNKKAYFLKGKIINHWSMILKEESISFEFEHKWLSSAKS